MIVNYFKLEEFYKPEFEKDVTTAVEFKLRVHIELLNKVRDKLKAPIVISQKSGFRPRWYELEKGRSGNSQHTFSCFGAVDLTCREDRLADLYELLVDSEYTRVCLYPEQKFIHCDMKGTTKQLFICLDGVTWERIEERATF